MGLEDSSLHADCRIFNVNKQRFRRKSDGVHGDFFVLDTNDWVNVLAITPEEQIVLVRQFRYGTQEFSLEPPGGVIEKGEDPIVAGLRELEEETGFLVMSLIRLVLHDPMRRFFLIIVILSWLRMHESC